MVVSKENKMLKISIVIRRGEYLVPGYLLGLSADLKGMPVTFFFTFYFKTSAPILLASFL